MKKYLFIIIATYLSSCKEKEIIHQENREIKIVDSTKTVHKTPNEEEVNDLALQIGKLYNPEKMSIKGHRVGTHNEKENYQVILTNSDLLDSDIANLEKHVKKIATNYYKFLNQNIKPFNFKKLIIKIEHRNAKTDSFEYSEENINQLLNLK